MEKTEVSFLNQLSKSLAEAETKLERAYQRGDYESFDKLKKFIILVQEKMLEVIK